MISVDTQVTHCSLGEQKTISSKFNIGIEACAYIWIPFIHVQVSTLVLVSKAFEQMIDDWTSV
jgi:hypothetical protein